MSQRPIHTLLLSFMFALRGVAPVEAVPTFPVKYSTDGRYLVDQRGTPFAVMGRTAWFLTSLDTADYRTFVDDTAARGFSAVELHVISHDPRGNHPPFDGQRNAPFLKRLDEAGWTGELSYGAIEDEAPDFATPNEAYWRRVDDLLSYCEIQGLLVFMFPAYVGFRGEAQGWMQEMVANGPARMQTYGAWIAARYRDRRNLVWMMGGDMGSFDPAEAATEQALLAGLKGVSGQQSTLFSAEWASESIAIDQPTFGGAMTLNGAYSWGGDVASQGRRAYDSHRVMPAFLLEGPYDEEGPDGNGVNPSAVQPVRRFQWWGWLSTIGGYVSGNGYVWPFREDSWWTFGDGSWRAHLDTQGSRDMGRLNAFMQSVAWHSLVPSGLDGMRDLIPVGGSAPGIADYVTAAAARDGTLLIAYVPPAHTGSIGVDMDAIHAPATGRWFDPTAGTYVPIDTGTIETGVHLFTPPGENSGGQGDWVLVLEARGPSSMAPSPTGR
jgi:Protein of unknown function (DUF4038)/Putative collagen-binding domain of a collagenase